MHGGDQKASRQESPSRREHRHRNLCSLVIGPGRDQSDQRRVLLEDLESKVGEADGDRIWGDPNKPWEDCLGFDA